LFASLSLGDDDDVSNNYNNSNDDTQDDTHEGRPIAGSPTYARSYRPLRVLVLRASTVLCIHCLPAPGSHSTHTTHTPVRLWCRYVSPVFPLPARALSLSHLQPACCCCTACWPLVRPLSHPPLVSACRVGNRRRLVCTPARGSSPPNPQLNISHTPWFQRVVLSILYNLTILHTPGLDVWVCSCSDSGVQILAKATGQVTETNPCLTLARPQSSLT